MMLNCAVLDDYQDCAFGFADLTVVERAQVKNFTAPITTPGALAEHLAPLKIIVALRELIRFDEDLLARLKRFPSPSGFLRNNSDFTSF